MREATRGTLVASRIESRRWDSNPRPMLYESIATTAELRRQPILPSGNPTSAVKPDKINRAAVRSWLEFRLQAVFGAPGRLKAELQRRHQRAGSVLVGVPPSGGVFGKTA
jgi:hypothetical protein